MENIFNMHEAKTQFSKLAKRVGEGEEILIARNGVPIMKLVKFEPAEAPERDFSSLKGLISEVSDEEWAAMDKEILSMWKYSESLDDN